jgi:hypothetical protein
MIIIVNKYWNIKSNSEVENILYNLIISSLFNKGLYELLLIVFNKVYKKENDILDTKYNIIHYITDVDGINKKFIPQNVISPYQKTINQMESFSNTKVVFEKISIFKNVMDFITLEVSDLLKKKVELNLDDYYPILTFVICKSKPQHFYSQFKMLEEFCDDYKGFLFF